MQLAVKTSDLEDVQKQLASLRDANPDAYENNIYGDLPTGSTVPATIGPPPGTPLNLDTIAVPKVLATKYVGVTPTDYRTLFSAPQPADC